MCVCVCMSLDPVYALCCDKFCRGVLVGWQVGGDCVDGDNDE